jgi:glycosyltransferase involved in cell wall biosynthesis
MGGWVEVRLAGSKRPRLPETRRSGRPAARVGLSMLKSGGEDRRRRVALVFAGVIEDFLDSVGLSLDDFCKCMTGGWCFGYIDALRSAGWQTTLFCTSRQVEASTRLRHIPSNTPICVLPVWRTYRSVTHGMIDPYGGSGQRALGRATGLRRFTRFARREVAPYLATPIGALVHYLRREGCAAILAQDYEYARFDICVLLGRVLRLPVFATFQGGAGHTGRLEHLTRPRALRAAHGLVIGADGEAQRVIEHYGADPKKIWQIPNPIDLDLWRPMDRDEARRQLGLPPHTRIVIYHGRIQMHHKGLDVLLDAWERARASPIGRDARLLMIGSGRDDAILRERLERPELSGIQWIDRYELDRTVMRRYLSAADLYVLASRGEGFPVAPLEAMACGLPIVGSDIPAMRNILRHGSASGGLIVPREDPRALAEALQELLDNPDLRRDLGRNARRNVEERFSIESVGRQLDQMLSQG